MFLFFEIIKKPSEIMGHERIGRNPDGVSYRIFDYLPRRIRFPRVILNYGKCPNDLRNTEIVVKYIDFFRGP